MIFSVVVIVGLYQIKDINSINDIARITRNFLWKLALLDGGQEAARYMIDSADKEHWWFRFQNNRYLPSVFSFIHPATSARTTHGIPAVYFMFQPVQSFNRRSSPPGTEIKESVRQQIRDIHFKKNMGYNVELMSSYYEGCKVIESLDNTIITKWWQSDPYL